MGLLKEGRGTCGTSAKIPVILADGPHVLRSGDEDVEMKMEMWR